MYNRLVDILVRSTRTVLLVLFYTVGYFEKYGRETFLIPHLHMSSIYVFLYICLCSCVCMCTCVQSPEDDLEILCTVPRDLPSF